MSILSVLEETKVVSVNLCDNNKLLLILEECDEYFGRTLDKNAVLLLIAELQEISDSMVFLRPLEPNKATIYLDGQ